MLPLSWLYGCLLWCRNIAYDKGWLKSRDLPIRSIALGNLSLGGTGKTPHADLLLKICAEQAPALISRGYGRKSREPLVVTAAHSASECGDEPLLLARRNRSSKVVVDPLRLRASRYIQANYPEVGVLILDDALQHRKARANYYILLTTFSEPFYADHYLPAGSLRDHKRRARDAAMIVVTKCPDTLTEKQRSEKLKQLSGYGVPIFFDKIAYGNVLPLHAAQEAIDAYPYVMLVTGIADARDFNRRCSEQFKVVKHFEYPDHYRYRRRDIRRFQDFIDSFAPGKIALLTTEKDAMRLLEKSLATLLESIPVFYWSIEIDLGNQRTSFEDHIRRFAGLH